MPHVCLISHVLIFLCNFLLHENDIDESNLNIIDQISTVLKTQFCHNSLKIISLHENGNADEKLRCSYTHVPWALVHWHVTELTQPTIVYIVPFGTNTNSATVSVALTLRQSWYSNLSALLEWLSGSCVQLLCGRSWVFTEAGSHQTP